MPPKSQPRPGVPRSGSELIHLKILECLLHHDQIADIKFQGFQRPESDVALQPRPQHRIHLPRRMVASAAPVSIHRDKKRSTLRLKLLPQSGEEGLAVCRYVRLHDDHSKAFKHES